MNGRHRQHQVPFVDVGVPGLKLDGAQITSLAASTEYDTRGGARLLGDVGVGES